MAQEYIQWFFHISEIPEFYRVIDGSCGDMLVVFVKIDREDFGQMRLMFDWRTIASNVPDFE